MNKIAKCPLGPQFPEPFLQYLRGPSTNDVSSKGEGGWGVKNVGIYLVKRRQREREGVIKSEKWADVVYGWPLIYIYRVGAIMHINHT